MTEDSGTIFGALKDNPSDIESIREWLHLYRGKDVALDDDVCRDIDLDDLFCYADRCITPVGELMLYDRFRKMKRRTRVADDEDDISKIKDDADFRAKVEAALNAVNGRKGLSMQSLLNMTVRMEKWHRFSWLILVAEWVILVLMILYLPPAIAIVTGLAAVGFNIYVHYRNKTYVDLFIRPLIQLDQIRGAAVRLSEIDRFNPLQEVDHSVSNLSKLSRKLRIFTLNGILESDIMIVFYGLIELLKIIFCVEPMMTYRILRKIDDVSKDSRTLLEYIGGWDVLYSIASFRTWMDSCGFVRSFPKFVPESRTLDAENIYHPLITIYR